MLASGRYPQWRSRFLRYVDIGPNDEALRKCIMSGPYNPTTVLVQAIEATNNSPAVLEHTTVETPMNMSPENKAHFLAEKKAIHLILTGIRDDIYLTVDACQIAQEMWEAIERLQQGNLDILLRNEESQKGLRTPRITRRRCCCAMETNDSNVIPDSPDMCEDDIQNDQNDIQKQLKKANTTLAQELKDYKAVRAKTRKSLGESISVRDSCLVSLQTKQTEFEKYKAFNDRNINYDKLEHALAELQCMYLHKVKECDCLAQKLSKQTESVSKKVHNKLLQRFAKVEKHSISLEIALQKCKEQGKSVDTKFNRPSVVRQPNAQRIPKPSVLSIPTPFSDSLERRYFPKTKSVPKTNVSEGLSKSVTAQTLPKIAGKVVSNTNVLKSRMYRIDKRPHLKSNQSRDKVLQNNSQVKVKKTQVEVHPRILSVSNKMKSVTACKDSLNFKTLNANVVCATCNKCLVNSNHFACVTKMLNDMHARTKKPTVVPISTRKPKSQANKSIATPNKKKVASKSTSQKPQSYFRVLYENTSKAWKWWIERKSPSGYKWVTKPKKQWVPKAKKQWVPKARNENVQKRVSFAVDNASRITNVLKRTNYLGSNLSTVPSSSNSLAHCTTHPIHC
nr:hypothetical protein [Tanacetum cinerariifolium]